MSALTVVNLVAIVSPKMASNGMFPFITRKLHLKNSDGSANTWYYVRLLFFFCQYFLKIKKSLLSQSFVFEFL